GLARRLDGRCGAVSRRTLRLDRHRHRWLRTRDFLVHNDVDGGRQLTLLLDCRANVDRLDFIGHGRQNQRSRSNGIELDTQLIECDKPHFAIGAAQCHALAKDIVRDNLLLAAAGAQQLSLLREAFALLDIELVLVAEAAHEATARARDLRGIERQALILRDAEIDGTQFRQPGARAVLPPAAPDTIESFGLVTDADLLQLNARPEHRREVADQITEIDALLGREVKRELFPIPLPLGVRDLHDELICLDALHRLPARVLILAANFAEAPQVIVRCNPADFLRRCGFAETVGGAGAAFGRQVAERVYVAKIFAAIGVDDHRRFERRRFVRLPEKEFLAIALERDFDEVRHASQSRGRRKAGARILARLLHELAKTLKFLPPAPNELVGLEAAQLVQMTTKRVLHGLRRRLVVGVRSAERLWDDFVDNAQLVKIGGRDL